MDAELEPNAQVSRQALHAASLAGAARHACELARTSKSSLAALIMTPNAPNDCHVVKVRAI